MENWNEMTEIIKVKQITYESTFSGKIFKQTI